MVIEMTGVVAFQPFSPSKLQYSECWSCEALWEKEELHVKLKSVEYAVDTLDGIQPIKCYNLINNVLINRRKQ